MSKPFLNWFPAKVAWAVLIIGLGGSTAACNQQYFSSQVTAPMPSAVPAVGKTTQPSPVATPVKSATPKTDPYQQAIERASNAYTMGRSAQSRDDWRLVVNRWQQAIELMQTVPNSNARHQQAKQKLAEYRQHLVHAQQQANRSTKVANPDGVIVLPRQAGVLPSPSPRPVVTPSPLATTPGVKPQQSNQSRTFYAPIIRRDGNTPVVRVKFNGSQVFDMIVDTGASGTLITSPMASALGVVPVAQASVNTASQKSVIFPLGYVQSIEVGGAQASNVMVAIAGPELDVGLLGHDFFGHYDVTIREKEVEFRERG